MKKGNIKQKSKISAIIVLITTIIFTSGIIIKASKVVYADINALDNIENQIVTLDGLNYSSNDIKKIIKLTNDDVTFYIEDYADSIVIGILNSKGEPEDIREIKLTTTKN